MAQEPVVEEAVEGESPKPKSKKKLIIIIVAAVVALAAVGGGVAWFMSSKSEHHEAKSKKADGEEASAKDEESKAHEESKEEAAPAAEPVFVKMDTFTVNLDPEEGEKYLQVDITLNASNQAEADLLTAQMPQVRNRVLMLLTSKKASQISSMEGKKALSDELTQQLNQPYTPGAKPLKLAGVFFTSFVIQ